MKIKSNTVLKDLKGNDLKDGSNEIVTIGSSLGVILTNAKEGGKMKLFILAQKFVEGKDVEVDQADLGLITKAVEASEVYNNLVLGQLLVMLENVKESTKK